MTSRNRKMELECIEDKIKRDKLLDFFKKLNIVKNIIKKIEDGVPSDDMWRDVSKRYVPAEKVVQFMCQVEPYYIYQAIKYAGVQNRKLSLKCWLNELSLEEDRTYDTHNNLTQKHILQLREPFIKAYLIQRTIPLEDVFKEYIKLNTTFRAISLISRLKINGYTLSRLPKTKKGILLEKSQRRLERILYLEKIAQYRNEGRKIIYLEERITFQKNVSNSNYEFQDFACTHCVLLLNDEGIVVNYDLIFRHLHDGASQFLLNFFQSNVDALPPNCVVVIGDRGHHKRDAPPLPTKFSTKKQMTDWLDHNNIEHNPNWHRAELNKLIEVHKRNCKGAYYVDDFIKFYGYDVLRCPFHCQFFSHTNDFWKDAQNFVLKKSMKKVLSFIIKESIKEAIDECTPAVWKKKEKIMIEEEHRILKEDLQVEEITDRLCTMMKYGDADSNHLDTIDLEYPLMEVDYKFSKLVASSLDETEHYLIRP